MKLISKTAAKALLLAVCCISASGITNAATYTWRGTNSTVWTTAGNWLALSVGPTGTAGIGHRLDVNNNTNNGLVYDASLGTTIYGTNGIRGFTIGSGSLSNGTLTITGGSFITANGSGGDVIGNSENNTGTLNVSGGTFVSGSSVLAIGLGGGVNRTSAMNVNSGSATAGSISINTLRGTINLNGGTLAASNIVVSSINGVNATNNFNGGTLQARGNSTGFFPTAPLAVSRAQVRNGGAIIDTVGFNITMAQPLIHSTITGDAVLDGGLTKNGNGTLTLSGVPTYTGPTIVNSGRLTTPLPTTSSALVLAAGTRFTPALTNATWLAASAALTNSTIDFNYGSFIANPNTSAAMYLTNLAISGSVTCNISGTGFPVTNITLLSYGSKTGGGAFVLGSLPAGAVATLNDDGANVTLNITAPSIQNLVWSTGDGIWQTNGGLNWNGGTGTYLEYPSGVNDVVTFDDTASGTVTITGQVNPSGTIVNVTGSFYTFSGTGSIGGTNGIAKAGTSTLQINNANNFTGPVTISGGSGTSGGTLFVNNPSALGATNGTVTVNGPANTLEIGVPGGNGIAVSNKTVIINGTGVGGARGALRGAGVAAGQTNIWAGPVIVATDAARIGTEDNGNIVLAGNISDSGANLGLLIRPGLNGTVTVASTGNSYAYTRTFGDSATSFVKLGANDAFATNSLQLGNGNVDLNGYNQTVSSIVDFSLSGTSTVLNNGATQSTLTIDNGTNSAGFSTVTAFTDGTSVLNIVKKGIGSETLSGANVTYSGTTTILGGQLNLTSANPMNTAITVGSGATLGGKATTTNSLTFQSGSIFSFDPSTVGSFTANTIDATASPIKISLASTTTNDALVLNAPNGITGSAANFQVIGSRGGSFYLTNGNTQLMFAPSTVNASLVWKGNNGTSPTVWNTVITTNWSNGGTPDAFYGGDNVTFDDTASTYTVSISGTVQPSSVTVNATNNYTISGTLGGGGTVTKGGSGTLTLNNNNSYTGLTVITNGVINIQTSGGLGTTASGTVIANSGTLDVGTPAVTANTINLGAEVLTISGSGFGGQGAVVNNSPVFAPQINAVQQIVLADNSSIGGSARWDMRGTGNALDMQATNTLTKVGASYIALVSTTVNNPGNIVVNGGTLGIQVNANLNGTSANTCTVNSGGTLELYQAANNPVWSLVLNGGSILWAENGSGGQNDWAGPVALNGVATLQADAVLHISGEITGSGSIIKTGNNTAYLTASNSYTGNTTINAGTLQLDWATLASGSTVTVASNSVLNLNFIGTNTVAALVLNGVSQPAGVYDATSGAPYITGTGALQVVSAGTPTLSAISTGSSLQITFAGGTLQAQTNALSTGLSTNWVNYPGTSPVTVPINPANGSVFFRVKQ